MKSVPPVFFSISSRKEIQIGIAEKVGQTVKDKNGIQMVFPDVSQYAVVIVTKVDHMDPGIILQKKGEKGIGVRIPEDQQRRSIGLPGIDTDQRTVAAQEESVLIFCIKHGFFI